MCFGHSDDPEGGNLVGLTADHFNTVRDLMDEANELEVTRYDDFGFLMSCDHTELLLSAHCLDSK